MKENLDFNPIEHHIQRIKKQLLDEWSKLDTDSELRPIFLFEENYNSLSAYGIEMHKEHLFEIEIRGKQNTIKLLTKETSYYVRKPMAFFDFAIAIKQVPEIGNSILYLDSKEDDDIIRNLGEGFNEMENIHIIGRHLICRGIIINSIKSFCQNMGITSLEFQTTNKRVHFVDSTNGIVYQGIRSCLSEIFGIDKDEVHMIIEKEASN
jgi:hypothetical protein